MQMNASTAWKKHFYDMNKSIVVLFADTMSSKEKMNFRNFQGKKQTVSIV